MKLKRGNRLAGRWRMADDEETCGRPAPTAEQIRQGHEKMFGIIERTQAFLHKRQSPDAFMNRLRQTYPVPRYFLETERKVLERVGIPRLDAFYYTLIPALTRTCQSQQWGARPMLNTFWLMREYIKTLYVGMHVECFGLVMLDRRGRLIRTALLQRGAVDNAPFYLGQVQSVVLQEEARFLVLAHNHPGGTKRPSREDLLCTLRTLNAFAPMRIPLLDHVIVVHDDVVSVRHTGMIPDILWTATLPGSRIVNRWLDEKLNNS